MVIALYNFLYVTLHESLDNRLSQFVLRPGFFELINQHVRVTVCTYNLQTTTVVALRPTLLVNSYCKIDI